MKAACIVITVFIGVAIMAICVMVKYATDITVEEKKRESNLAPQTHAVYNMPKSMGIFNLNENHSQAGSARFPYIAAIIRNSTSDSFSFYCFGSIILIKWVITAAHCKSHNSIHRVLLYPDFSRNHSHTYPIVLWKIHENYNTSNPTAKYDIALAKMDVKSYPLNLKSSVFDYNKVTEIEASIWKTVFTMDKKQYLTNDLGIYTNFNLVSHGKCFENYGVEIDDSMMCVDLSKYDDCFINEFGPVYNKDKVVGVLAVMPRDCDTKVAVFTNVSYYVSWVLKSTQGTKETFVH